MIKSSNFSKYFNLLLIALFLTGCNSSGVIRLYDGVERNKAEISTFVFPIALEVLEVDGKNVSTVIMTSELTYQMQLLPGKHFIKAVYSEFWGTEKLGNMVKSDADYFAVDAKAGSQYLFEHDGPTDLVNAPKLSLSKNIKIWVLDQESGNKITPTSEQGYGSFLTNLVNSEPPPQKNQAVIVPTQQADPAMQQTVVTQLKYWWNLANEKQREIFQQWLATQ